MNCINLIKQKVKITEFVDFWSKAYGYASNKDYEDHVKNRPLSEDDIRILYKWKNGMQLSRLKQESLKTKIINNLNTINSLSQNFDLDKFKTEFKSVSAIWKFLLLHIIQPEKYPMLDEYVMRAYKFLSEIATEIPSNDSDKEDFYFRYYVDFFNDIANRVKSKYTRKQVDEALWAFGKFLKSNYGQMLFYKKFQQNFT